MTIADSITHEVVTPHVIAIRRPQASTRSAVQPQLPSQVKLPQNNSLTFTVLDAGLQQHFGWARCRSICGERHETVMGAVPEVGEVAVESMTQELSDSDNHSGNVLSSTPFA